MVKRGVHGNGVGGGGGTRQRGHKCQWGVRTVKGGVHGNGGHAWPRGVYTRAPNDGRGLTPCGWRGAHTYVPIIGGAN
jgi:hypothetical protein